MAEEIGSLAVKIGLDSSGFQNGVSSINRQLKVLDSEFKANTAALGANAKGIDGLKVKAESLAETMELQKQKVVSLEGAYQKSVESKGKDAKATQDLEIKLNNARAALSKTETAISQTSKEIDNQTDNWVKLGKSAQEAGDKLSKIGSSTSSVGKTLTLGVTTPIIGIGTAAVNAGMEFEAQMSRVQAIIGATGEEFTQLNEQALQLGSDTAFSASEAAQGMENLASAGFNTTQIMSAMPGMLSLAASGGVDIATASDIAASALNGFGLEADQAGHVADVLASAASATNAGVTDMGSALKYVAPPANALGLSLEEVSAAIGVMSNAGIKGEQAGTTLRGALTKLASPSSEAAKTMSQLGINAFDSQGKMLPLSQVIGNLQTGMKGLTDEQKQNAIATIFGQESMSGMLTLIQAGPAELDKLTTSFKSSDGAAAAMANTMQNNTKGAVEEMKGSLETAGIKISQVLAPAIKGIADAVGSLADKFASLTPAQQQVILVLAGLAAAIGPVLMIIGTMISSVGAIVGAFGAASAAIGAAGGAMAILTGPIGIAVAAIAGAIAIGVLLYQNWDTIKAKAGELLSSISSKFSSIKEAIQNPIKAATDFVRTQVDNIGSFFSNLKLTLPQIKLPHFSLTGSFSLMPPSVPKLSVNWYDTGGIFSSPSIIGVGEKRTEFVGALDDLRYLIRDELNKSKNNSGSNLNVNIENFNNNRSQDVQAFAEELEFYRRQRSLGLGGSY
jgi:TP901 family phage tail tape measure protein